MGKKKTPGSDAGDVRVRARARSKSGAQMQQLAQEKNWSPESERAFLDELAVTSSVALAAKATGFVPATAYYHRRIDPLFSRAWDEAKAEGVARVEMELVRAAREALTGEKRPPNEADKDWRLPPISFDQAIAVVRLFHGRDSADGVPNGPRARRHWHWTPLDPAKAREAILRQVAAVRRSWGLDDEPATA